MKCPECGGRMTKKLNFQNLVIVTCQNQECRYVCPSSYVSGYWAGYKAGHKGAMNLLSRPGIRAVDWMEDNFGVGDCACNNTQCTCGIMNPTTSNCTGCSGGPGEHEPDCTVMEEIRLGKCEYYPFEEEGVVCGAGSDISASFVCTKEYATECRWAKEREG